MRKRFDKIITKGLMLLLTIVMGINFISTSTIFATDEIAQVTTKDNENQIEGTRKEDNEELSGFSSASLLEENGNTKESGKQDISAIIKLTSLNAWMNGSHVYEMGKQPTFPASIHNGVSFKIALAWSVKDTISEPLKGGDYFSIDIGKINGLADPSKKEKLYIDGVLVGESNFIYKNDELKYTITFNDNISYFNDVQGNFSSSSTFANLPENGKVDIIFQSDGKGSIDVEKAPEKPSGDQTGIGFPSVSPINKDKITIGKSTFFQDYNKPIFGWRTVFTELLHRNQNNITKPENKVYADVIIEDTLDENQEFTGMDSPTDAPFFLDIPLILPGTQSAVAYTGSNTTNGVTKVVQEGNGNSDYIIKSDKFTYKTDVDEVRATPLTWTIDKSGTKQKMIINVGKLGTTDPSLGITSKHITIRKLENRNPIDISDSSKIETVINTELNKYKAIRNNDYSPFKTLQATFVEFSKLYNPTLPDFVNYKSEFDTYIGKQDENKAPSNNPPGIPEKLKLDTVIKDQAYKAFEKALTAYATTNMKDYLEKMKPGSDYLKAVDETISALKEAIPYYQAQGDRIYGFCLKYKTNLTNLSSGKVSNSVNIVTGTEKFKDEVEIKHKYSAGISGVFKSGDIVIVKADSTYGYSDTTISTDKDLKGMKNIKFEVLDKNEKVVNFFNSVDSETGSYRMYAGTTIGDKIVTEVETDEFGKIILSGLIPKEKYYLREITNSSGYYEAQNQKISFSVESSKVNYKLVENDARIVTFKKLDKGTSTDVTPVALKDAVFALYKEDGTQLKHFESEKINNVNYYTYTDQDTISDVENLTTLDDGVIRVKNLPAGKYYFKEVSAPSGYILSTDKIEFELKKDSHTTSNVAVDLGTVYNIKEDSSITMQKVDKETLIPLKDVAFELYKEANDGSWKLVEASSYNSAGKFITDQELDGDALQTSDGGTISVSDLPVGKYYLKEAKVLDGYLLNQTKYHFEIDGMSKGSQLYLYKTPDGSSKDRVENNMITNVKGTGKIQLIKYDRSQGASVSVNNSSKKLDQVFYDDGKTLFQVNKPLADVKFDLYQQLGSTINTATDKKIGSFSTNADGKITVSSLVLGTYYFVETKALPNYQLNVEPIVFKLTHQDVQVDSKTLTKLVDNNFVDYRLVINKLDKKTKDPLQGAQFEVYDSKYKLMKFTYRNDSKLYECDEDGTATLVTNREGKIVIKGLLADQTYFIKETKAPEDYTVDTNFQSYGIFITAVDDAAVVNEPVIKEITCLNERIRTPVKPVEPVEPMDPLKPSPPNTNQNTGDTTTVLPWIVFLVLDIGCLGYILKKKRRVKNN